MVKNRIEDGVPPETLSSVRFTPAERDSLVRLAVNSRVAARKQCVRWLSSGIDVAANRRFVLDLLGRLLPDRSPEVRWNSLRLLGTYAQPAPDELWPLVARWGCVKNRSLRAGIACFVLEHVLEHHFSTYFPRVGDLAQHGNREFAYTFACCQKLGQARHGRNSQAVDALMGKLRRTHPEVARYFALPSRSCRNKWLQECRLAEELLGMSEGLQSLLAAIARKMSDR